MRLTGRFKWQGGSSLSWQLLGISIAWLYIVRLHWNNDGLWFQGDAPRHAGNGLFWWDFLSAIPVNPVEFAASYYARYPVIHPTGYPPLFYLLEGFFFSVFGASPYIAKGLVSTFALVGGVYLIAWLRRWVAPEAGWGSVLLMLQPGVIGWSNAVMLNVPSMAIGFAALYHTRRWIESPDSRHLYLAVCFALGGVFVYIQTGIVLPIMLAWILAERRWKIVHDRRAWIILLLSVALLLPLAFVVRQWAPIHFATVFGDLQDRWKLDRWTFYLEHLHRIALPLLVFLASIGIALAAWTNGGRKELKYLLVWIFVCYASFSYIWAKEARYVLLLLPPLVILSVIAVLQLSRWSSPIFRRYTTSVFITVAGLVTVFHVSMAPLVRIPHIKGFEEVVAFLEEVAPRGRIFYDGKYDGIFSFYVRARDPNFERGVVLGDKLLYASAIFTRWNLTEYVHSPSEVIEVLRTKCGCRWLAIERRGVSDEVAAARYLREALGGPEFEYVKSFPIRAPQPTHVHVYRFLPPITVPEKLELPFPTLGSKAGFKASPVTR